jgi:hypothetical protein
MPNDFREHLIEKLKAIDYHDIVENEMTETINCEKIADVMIGAMTEYAVWLLEGGKNNAE